MRAGGGLIGLGFGIAMRYVLRWMRHLGAGIEQQVAMTFACGYLAYYTANAPAAVSGASPRHPPSPLHRAFQHNGPLLNIRSLSNLELRTVSGCICMSLAQPLL
jgi:hypothetical protein